MMSFYEKLLPLVRISYSLICFGNLAKRVGIPVLNYIPLCYLNRIVEVEKMPIKLRTESTDRTDSSCKIICVVNYLRYC